MSELSDAFAERAAFEKSRIDARRSLGNGQPTPLVYDFSVIGAAAAERALNKATAKLSPKQVIKLARQRLRDVRRELKATRKTLRSLEREETELSRLLDAADGKPNRPASVRELRRPA